MSTGASVAERAVGLPWLRPAAAAFRAVTADPPDVAGVVADPAAVAHVLRYCRPTASPDCHPFTPAGLLQPAIIGAAADLLEHVGSHSHEQPTLTRFARSVSAVAGELARAEGVDAVLASAVTGLVPLGWLAVAAVEPLSCAEIRFRLASPDRQREQWGLDAVAVGRRLAARWRLPEWLTSTIGLIRLHPADAVRGGAPERLFPLVQRAVATVEADWLRLGLTDPGVVGRVPTLPHVRLPDDEPTGAAVPDWALSRLLRAVAATRRSSGAVWQADADARADRLADALARLRADWDAELRDAKLAGLAEFAAGASHEINNPLAVIAGHAQMLMQKEADPARRKQLAAILRQTDRVHDLLRGTLQFARPPAAQSSVTPLADLLDRCANSHAAEFGANEVSLAVGRADGLFVAGDADQLQRAVGQLLRNALEASAAGGEVRLWAERSEGRVTVCVADPGPGPSPDVVPHLFDPFYSGRSAGRGRGLGLSIAWRLARQNGGDLRYDPTPELPSRFTLSLPLAGSVRRSAG